MPAELELHADPVHQGPDRGPAGLDHIVRRLAVKGVPHLAEFAQLLQRVHTLQQRPLRVIAQPTRQFLGGAAQVEAEAVLAQKPAVRFGQRDAAVKALEQALSLMPQAPTGPALGLRKRIETDLAQFKSMA